MVKFLIGPPKIDKSSKTSADKVSSAVYKFATSNLMTIENNKFKMGNLDNMMQNYEIINKVEN
jgi:hypothetical protein